MLTAFLFPQLVFCQEKYPDRPITIIVGWTAGGMADIFARLLANATSKELGRPIVVENKPGAHGTIAAHSIVKAKPDGYTLGTGISSLFVVIPNIRDVSFDPVNDPTQILVFVDYYMGLVVRSDAPWKSWEEFRDYAKQNPGKVKYGTAGVGTMQHITFERVAQKEGIRWVHVPFKGGNEPVVALLGGHIDAAIQGPSDVVPHLTAGKLKMLLAVNDNRWDILPNVPHMMEKGYDFSTFSLLSIWGPKGLPESIRARLENAMQKALKDPSLVEASQKFQTKLRFMGGREYTKLLGEKFEGYRKIVKDLDLVEK